MDILTIITQTITVLLLAALWTVCLVGWGRALLQLAGIAPKTLSERMTSFWLGLAGVVVVTQIWHLVLPIDSALTILVLAVGMGFLAANSRGHGVREVRSSLFIGVYSGFALWAANRSISAPLLLDSGEYHFPTLRWLAEYRAVPGLGNLDPGLATNQSYFLYAALLNSFPFKEWGHHFANATLVLAGLVLPIRFVVAIVKRERETPMLLSTFHVLCLVPYSLLIRSMYMSCPTPDLAIDVLEITITGIVLEWICAARERQPFHLFAIAALIPLGLTLKLTFLFFGVPMGAFVLVRLLRSERHWPSQRVWIVWSVFAIMLAAAWILNGVIESGYPFFPSKIAAAPVDWRVPDSVMRYYANTIHSEKGTHMPWSSWDNYHKWLVFNFRRQDFSIKYPSVMAGLTALAAALFLGIGKLNRENYHVADLLITFSVGLSLWFLTSPIDRFAIELFWLISIVLASSLCTQVSSRRQRGIVASYIIVSVCLIGIRARWISGSAPEWPNAIPAPSLFEYRTASGLALHVPIPGPPGSSTYAWNSPVPVVRHPNYGLELRGHALFDGFRIRADTHTDMPVADAYFQLTGEIQSMEKALAIRDTARVDRSSRHIQQLYQVFADHILVAIPPKSPDLKDRLTEILCDSLQLQANQNLEASSQLASFARLKNLVDSLPDYYPSSVLERRNGTGE